MGAVVTSVARAAGHDFAKIAVPAITLIAGLGVEGDAHAGVTVQHRSRVAVDPTQPNLRQVHVIEEERFDWLAERGFAGIDAGAIGENVRTRGIALSALSRGTRLRIGENALIELTGLRNPCGQLDAYRSGLMRALMGRGADGAVRLMGGVMAVVIAGGVVQPGDGVAIEGGEPVPHVALERV